MTADAPQFSLIRVPVFWAGMTRQTSQGPAWTCGACSDPEACLAAGVCQRASDSDFKVPVYRGLAR